MIKLKHLYIIFCTILFISCSKEKETIPIEQPEIRPRWEKYIGTYQVYDTLGTYMYQMSIHHSQSNGEFPNDSLTIINFADTFDVTFLYQSNFNGNGGPNSKEYLNIGIHDSIIDYNGKSWFLGSNLYDLSTSDYENSLINDTMILFYEVDNIKYYIQEGEPYYRCDCKHMAVKQ